MQPEALQSISAALRKVKLKLTRQLGSIAIIMQMHVNKARPRGVFELAQLYECYKNSLKKCNPAGKALPNAALTMMVTPNLPTSHNKATLRSTLL